MCPMSMCGILQADTLKTVHDFLMERRKLHVLECQVLPWNFENGRILLLANVHWRSTLPCNG
jgi:hypothetical protein